MAMGGAESTEAKRVAPSPSNSRNQVRPVTESNESQQLQQDAARLRQQLQLEKEEHGRALEEAAAANRKRLDEAAATERRRLDAEAAKERKHLDEAAGVERFRLDQEAVVERSRVAEAAAAEGAADRLRQDQEAVAERKRLDDEAAANRTRQDGEAATERKRLDDEAAEQRRRLDGEAAAERRRLDDLAAAERKRLDQVAADLHVQLQNILAVLQSQPVHLTAEALQTAPSKQLDRVADPVPVAAPGPATPPAPAPAPTPAPVPVAVVAAASSPPGPTSVVGGEDPAVAERRRQEEEAAEKKRKLEEQALAAERLRQEKVAAAVAAEKRKAEETIERTWKGEDVLAGILKCGARLDELPESILDLHDGMPASLRQAPMRLLLLDSVLSWPNIKVYEEVKAGTECIELPYADVSQDTWNTTIILSWRWSLVKPSEYQEGFSPMSTAQYEELTAVIKRAKSQGIKHAWIDWCCVPQYCSSPMVEVLRSKVFYARARAMTVIPTFHTIPTDGIVRLLLVKAGRVIKKRAAGSPRSAIVAERLENILNKEQVAGREYFSRVWTLAERMARFGRPEQLCNWLSLEAWLGMLVDAMLKSTEDRSASEIYKRILGVEAGGRLDMILGPLEAAIKTGSMHVSEGIEDQMAELFELAVGIWHTAKELAEAPTKDWLTSYLLEAHSGIYQAWSDSDRVWSVYSYFCWKQLDQGSEAGLLEALQDLVRVAGGGRRHLMCMATKLGLAKAVPPADVDRQLAAAAESNNTKDILEALEAGAFPDVLGKDGGTPLWFAAASGNMEVMTALLHAGARVNITNMALSTPLNVASSGGHCEAVRTLLKAGADLEIAKQGGSTPLINAIENGHEQVVRVLLQAGANKDTADETARTPLYAAALGGHTAIARILLDAGADKNYKKSSGWSVIHAAAWKGHADTVKLFIHAGVDKEGVVVEDKRTPLHVAAEQGHASVVTALTEAGANKEAVSKFSTPLHCACRYGKTDAAQALVDAGALKEAREPVDKKTTLMVAAHSGHLAIVKLLVAARAVIEAEDKDGWRALHFAAKSNEVAVVKFLIASGANTKAQTHKGSKPYELTTDSRIKNMMPSGKGFFEALLS